MTVSSNDIHAILKPLLGMPEMCTMVTVRLRMNEAAEVECTFWASINDAQLVTKRYQLTELPEVPSVPT